MTLRPCPRCTSTGCQPGARVCGFLRWREMTVRFKDGTAKVEGYTENTPHGRERIRREADERLRWPNVASVETRPVDFTTGHGKGRWR